MRKVQSIQSPEFIQVQSELNDTKERLQRIEKYMEEKERINNVKKTWLKRI